MDSNDENKKQKCQNNCGSFNIFFENNAQACQNKHNPGYDNGICPEWYK